MCLVKKKKKLEKKTRKSKQTKIERKGHTVAARDRVEERFPSVRPRAQFISDQESPMFRNIMKDGISENNYYGGLRGGRPFATTNSGLVSATKLLNHHLFCSSTGPRHYTGHRRQISGTSTESKLSLSADSIDSEGVSFVNKRVSKSILKKSESSNNYYNNADDSDTEKLITDNASTITMCDNETNTCDMFTNANETRLKQPVSSPLLSKQVLESIFRTNNNIDKENEVDQSEEKNRASKMNRSILDDVLQEEKYAQDEAMTENKNKEERKKSKTKLEESSKDSQTMLICSLRPHKAKKLSCEEKRKAKATGHSGATTTDTNCLPQEHRFSS